MALRVLCGMFQCIYYAPTGVTGDKHCLCSHPDKPRHMFEESCPLYRLDWNRNAGQVDGLRDRFKIGSVYKKKR